VKKLDLKNLCPEQLIMTAQCVRWQPCPAYSCHPTLCVEDTSVGGYRPNSSQVIGKKWNVCRSVK
jgi:hypothetical protein